MSIPNVDLRSVIRRVDLLRDRCFTGGKWTAGEAEPFEVVNPATGAPILELAKATAEQAHNAIDAAKAAFGPWRAALAKDRGKVLRNWAEAMAAYREDLALIMTFEQGKPLGEARGEIDYAAGFLTWFAAEAERMDGDIIQPHLPDRRLIVIREPIGVAAAITPWNFPSAMITRKAGAALAAGCPMIVRPASETPLSALALAVLAEEAGVPPGVFSVLVGDGSTVGGALIESPDVSALSFTGSTEVGCEILRGCAGTVKRVSMELGGHAPFIVFDDAPLKKAVNDAIAAKFQTSGQDCLAANRILVQKPVYDAFCDQFVAETEGLKVGAGWTPGVDIGPLMNSGAIAKCRAQISDALSKGARLLTGCEGEGPGGNFLRPAVLADVTPEMKIFSEETFGPVAAITPFESEAEAITLANATKYGLAAYLYTENMRRIWRAGGHLEFGMVAVNTPKFTGPPIPFGGYKQSGLGREGSRHGFDDYTELKYMCWETA